MSADWDVSRRRPTAAACARSFHSMKIKDLKVYSKTNGQLVCGTDAELFCRCHCEALSPRDETLIKCSYKIKHD